MNTTVSDNLTRVGTAEVAPGPGNEWLGGASDAYVPVVGIAGSRVAFEAAICRAMGALDFELIDVEDVRQLLVPAELGHLDEALARHLHLLGPDNPVKLRSFHAFAPVLQC